MSAELLELQVHRQMEQNYGIAQYQNGTSGLQAQNCIGQYMQPYWYYCSCPSRSLAEFELVIEQIGSDEPRLDYGAKLRLLIADPIRGIDLRDALAKLKIALKEAIGK